ncbi:MAG TPA: hypothetical protein ENH55_01355 [Aurantimonas coralicida]|nr:hypothetical protein [Aurantimonas coralicida]
MCGLHADGRVLVAATKGVRRALQTSWASPVNSDFLHFGDLRGLDFAKHHVAAISVGRMELPPGVLSGLAAALTYDDEVPEPPSYRGSPASNGGAGRVHRTKRRLMMRDGRDVEIEVPEDPAKWGSLLQRQFREEELLQFVGRLRPVYRSGEPAVWYALTNALPDAIVWDELVGLERLIYRQDAHGSLPRGVWEIARRCGGIVSAELAMSQCRDIVGDSPAGAREIFLAEGLDPRQSAPLASFAARGWSSLSWVDHGGRNAFAWAAACLDDPLAVLLGRLTDAGYSPADGRILCKARFTRADAGEPDLLDASLGAEDERERQETSLRQAAWRQFDSEQGGGELRIGIDGLQWTGIVGGMTINRTMDQVLAQGAIERFHAWDREDRAREAAEKALRGSGRPDRQPSDE